MSATAANAKGEFYCHKCHDWRKPVFRTVQELQDGKLDTCSKCNRVLWEALAGPDSKNKIRIWKTPLYSRIKTCTPIDWNAGAAGILSVKVTLSKAQEQTLASPNLPAPVTDFIGQNLAVFNRVSWNGIIDRVLAPREKRQHVS